MAALRGVYTALVTPFGRDGSLRLRDVPALVDFQRAAGVDGLVVGGTNGEGISLSVAERKRLLEAVLEHAHGLEVIAATGASALPDALALTRHACKCAVAAVLVLPPFYFKNVAPQGVAAYYRAVVRSSTVPVVLYSIPQFSAVPITPRILKLLIGMPHLAGVKESSPERGPGMTLLDRYPSLKVFVGNDLYLADMLRAGAAGVISGTANAFPELIVAVAKAVREGVDPAASQARLDAAIGIMNSCPIVGAAKAVLEARGIARISVRPPLVMPSAQQQRVLFARLREVGLLPRP